jgi:hypothetical protein
LVEKLPDGTTGVLHDNPVALAKDFPAWVDFLDKWVSRHETNSAKPINTLPTSRIKQK